MKAIISAIIVAGALSQMANAMGPTGDITHRHFYKDQEWIWQDQQNQPKAQAGQDSAKKVSLTEIWHAPLAFVMPNHPSLAFVMPNHPSLAFVMPNHPSLAFVMPNHPSLAFVMPNHPSLAFVMPNHPSLAFVMPNYPSLVA